tara:strand:+ start:842 stop:1408 length:567 start_codon:yes stop_codon:yes gene_type:complete
MNFIETYFIEDLTLCDDIIKYFKDLPPNVKFEGSIGISNRRVDYSKKQSIEAPFHWNESIGSLSYRYAQELRKCSDQYIKKYPECNNKVGRWGIEETVKIQYYIPGGGYPEEHCERAERNCNRHLVFMTYLNDVEDCGETKFKLQNLKVKAEKGKTVIWPSDWTHTHCGVISPTQEKYIVTGWFSFVD